MTLTVSIHELNLQLTGWLRVQRVKKITWNLESRPLEIRTNSVLGSNDRVGVYFSAGGAGAGGVYLGFTSTPRYLLGGCKSWTNLPVNPPSPTDKVWRITVTKTAGVRLVIHCNDVEVLNTLISEATCSDSRWSWRGVKIFQKLIT